VKVIVKACWTACLEHFQTPSFPSVISNSQQLLPVLPITIHEYIKQKSTLKKNHEN
jgi:hypothetical protein